MVQQLISGAFAKVLYAKETVYGVPIGGKTPEGLKMITKILGHGIKVSSLNKDNAVKVVSGINNVEGTAHVDGPFTGKFSVDFEAVADISWMEFILGREKALATNEYQYMKDRIPCSMSWVIYFNNDNDNELAGQAFLLTGVVLTSVKMSIEAGESPLHVSLEMEYQTEYKIENLGDIPTINAPADAPFNYSMAQAQFWNPDVDTNGPASFDSIECLIDKVNFTIKRTATLQKGISNRIAGDKWVAGLEYDLSMSAAFKDPKKFLEKFYGCKDTPSKYIAPYEQISIVFENYFRDQRHAKLKFDFKVVKIKSISQPISLESLIMEDLTFAPLRCDIYSQRGAPGTPYFNVSPSLVEQGKSLYFSGGNFFPGEQITLTSSLLPGGSITTNANCLGELRYQYVIPDNQTTTVYTVSASSATSIPAGTPKVFQVTVAAEGQNMATLSVDKNVYGLNATQIVLSGANYGTGDVNLYLEVWNDATKAWDSSSAWSATVSSGSVANGAFTFSSGTGNMITMPAAGKYRFKAASTNGIGIAYYVVYVPSVTSAALSNDDKTLTISGAYFPPNQTAYLTYEDGTTVIAVGLHTIAYNGYLPGPSALDTIVYTRSVAFPTSSPAVKAVLTGVNSGSFTLTKSV